MKTLDKIKTVSRRIWNAKLKLEVSYDPWTFKPDADGDYDRTERKTLSVPLVVSGLVVIALILI